MKNTPVVFFCARKLFRRLEGGHLHSFASAILLKSNIKIDILGTKSYIKDVIDDGSVMSAAITRTHRSLGDRK